MGFRREVDRNGLKKWMKNNKISDEWHKFQMEKYGLAKYQEILKNNKKGK